MSEAAARVFWRTGRGVMQLDKPCVMGILNVTPDSFFDGGLHSGGAAALHRVEQMFQEGADIIDIGGESTRPGARPVTADEEVGRILPVLTSIVQEFGDAVISVDTVKSDVARAVAEEGAAVINDVSGLRLDEGIADVAAHNKLGLVLMHSRGTVSEMAQYRTADYGDDVVADIVEELAASMERAAEHGVAAEQVVIDPGLGFSKRTEHSVAVLRDLDRIVAAVGRPVLVGASRKRFVGELSGGLPADERLAGSLAAIVVAYIKGARIFRVHDVRAARHALDVAHAILKDQ